MKQEQETEALGASEISLPRRPIVFLGKHGWQGENPLLKQALVFLGIERENPCFFTNFQGDIRGFFSFVSDYRDLYSRACFLFPEGACGKKILEIIAQEFPGDMTYEVLEIDQSGRFFQRGSSWSLIMESL